MKNKIFIYKTMVSPEPFETLVQEGLFWKYDGKKFRTPESAVQAALIKNGYAPGHDSPAFVPHPR